MRDNLTEFRIVESMLHSMECVVVLKPQALEMSVVCARQDENPHNGGTLGDNNSTANLIDF